MEQFEKDIKACIATMQKGGAFLYPTDTVWGLGCDATDANAIKRVSEIKNRPQQKSYIVLMPDVQMLRKHLANPIPDLDSFIEEQKGATTIIYNNVIGIADNALASDGSLAIRIPKDEFCMGLLKRFRKPIISTSANISGAQNPSFYNQISEEVKAKVDYICDWRREDTQPKKPSTIIKIQDDGSLLKIR